MNARPAIDVSDLPGMTMESQETGWWGNLLFMLIETISVLMLVASYFYLRQNFMEWPPPAVDRMPPLYKPLPDLPLASWVTGLLVAATLPMYWADRAAYKFQAGHVMAGLTVASLLGIVAIVLRPYEFAALDFKWNDNAYGSLIWGLLLLQTLYLILEVAEAAILVLWIALYGIDKKLGADVTLATGYWVWTASTAVLVYVVVYWAPRVMSP